MNKKSAVIFIAAIMVLSALTVAFSLNEIALASPNVLHSDYKDTSAKATDINPKGGPSLLSGAASYDTSITMNSVLNPSTGYSFTNLFSSKNAYYTINPTTLSGQKYKISFREKATVRADKTIIAAMKITADFLFTKRVLILMIKFYPAP